MKILILGGNGMLGHQLFKYLSPNHNVRVTLRQPIEYYNKYKIFSIENAYAGIDIRSNDTVKGVLTDFRPDAVVNAIGIVKQREIAKKPIPSIEINALFPHKLAIICERLGIRLIHMSTDCVFSGTKGNYREEDLPDPNDLYGRTKLLGELQQENTLTLRSSIIGRELTEKKNLLEWFLSQKSKINGYKKAIFSGFTTLEMSRIIENLLLNFPAATGLYHVSSYPINKYDLLVLLRDKFNFKLEIDADDTYECNRSLDSTRFRREFSYVSPTWEAMIDELILNL
ncbi:MAG: SDR family oxidoreductase [Desulfobacterales bacterium]|nr:SDR family oxidoreductase [Desulfobacterales bacterium]